MSRSVTRRPPPLLRPDERRSGPAPRLREARRRGLGRAQCRGRRAPAPQLRGAHGQAAVELVGFLPLVVVLALTAFTAISAYTAHEQAGEAAEAAALALLQGGSDPRAAATEALPERARARAAIKLAGPRVHVRVLPRVALPIPGLADRLAGEATANAGPITP
jgi:hypothetical protein